MRPDIPSPFREVLTQDPSCAIANWGIAAILMDNPLAGVGSSPRGAERAQRAIDEGRRIGAKTQRERDYIEAVAAYYQDWAHRPERARQQSRAKAFEALAARYPGDDEAQIFYALYLSGTQSLADQSYASYLKAAEILEKQFAKHPDHPGVAHYLIHSYDAAPIAQKGLPAARRYSGPYALAAIPARYAIERGDWRQAAKAQPIPSKYAYVDALTYFARALGAARSGDPVSAENDVQELAVLRDALRTAKNEYWATEVEVSRLAAAAWAAWARGRHEEALSLMRNAADIEDKSEKHIVTPGRIAPARELLGDMLLELKRPAEALKEFRGLADA